MNKKAKSSSAEAAPKASSQEEKAKQPVSGNKSAEAAQDASSSTNEAENKENQGQPPVSPKQPESVSKFKSNLSHNGKFYAKGSEHKLSDDELRLFRSLDVLE